MGVLGNKDQGPSPADVDDCEAALKNTSVPYEFYRYEGAGHGFQDAGKPERYREEQLEDAWAKAIGFLDGYFEGLGDRLSACC